MFHYMNIDFMKILQAKNVFSDLEDDSFLPRQWQLAAQGSVMMRTTGKGLEQGPTLFS